MCKFQLITTNKNMKKWLTPQDVYNKDADQTVLLHNRMPVFIQPAHGGGPLSPARKTAFKCRFAGRPIVARLKNLCSQRLWLDCTIWCPILSIQHTVSDHYRPESEMAFNWTPGMFYSFWHANSSLQNISLNVLINFSRPSKWWQVRTYSNLWSNKLPLIASHVPLVS